MLHALVAQTLQNTDDMETHGAGVTLPPLACAIIAICILIAMLIVTWAFRSAGTRH
ncbi:MAG: hypothetical protein ACRYF3_13960 [Janthinobacterium lividum]